MAYMRLTVKDRKDGKLTLSPGIGFRIIMFVSAAVIVFSLVLSGGAPGYSGIFGCIITAVCIIGALYEEKWLFDPENRLIRNSSGLLILSAKKTIYFSEIDKMQLKSIRQNKGIKWMARERYLYILIIKKKDGSEITVDIDRSQGIIQPIAKRISSFCGIPLTTA